MPAARIDGNALTTVVDNTNNDNNFISVAPGEGQFPTSVLREDEWDIRTYPHLYPDGLNGMHAKGRTVKLYNQQYIVQRLFNIDKTFANDPAYLFSCLHYIENRQLERNISLSFQHGSKTVGENGQRSFKVN